MAPPSSAANKLHHANAPPNAVRHRGRRTTCHPPRLSSLVSFARGPRESLERAAGLLNELPRERTPEQREEQGAAARQAAPQRRIGEQQLPQDTDARLQQAVEALGRDDNKARSPLNCGGGRGGWGREVVGNTKTPASPRSIFTREGSFIIAYTSIT